ncbi:MAG: AI-2E family transporter [Thiotrichales bacterium]|nr:MAG: AI-2E family transporter [Thiotrichales bacterium]
MIANLQQWFKRHFSDPEATLLLVLLLIVSTAIFMFGDILAPVLASMVIAYLLEWLIEALQRIKVPRLPAVLLVYVGFLGVFTLALFILLPLLWKQLAALFENLPTIFSKVQQELTSLAQQFPEYLSAAQVQEFTSSIGINAQSWGKVALSYSLASIPDMLTWVIYLVLMPIIVFFLLKDKAVISNWFQNYLPKKRQVLSKVSLEVNGQIGNYLRGKASEILIVGGVTYAVFAYFNMQYAALLAFLVGFSVLIPYIGAVLVTIPVILVGYLQWGLTSDFSYMLIAFAIVQALDGNVLVPLLFSEAVNLHPVAIIIAILVFSGIWGFWGAFFAIPLATLVKALLYAWPSRNA